MMMPWGVLDARYEEIVRARISDSGSPEGKDSWFLMIDDVYLEQPGDGNPGVVLLVGANMIDCDPEG